MNQKQYKKCLSELSIIGKEVSVLYVEDEESVRSANVRIFQKFFSSLTVAKDGQEGLELYKNGSFDLIITDINMPRMNGIEMTKHIKEDNSDQQVLVFSAYNEIDRLTELINIGIDGFLLRPADEHQLAQALYKAAKISLEQKLLAEYQEYLKKQLGIQENDFREKLTLLKQYENAIDISAAFCRSDKEDRIVYANEMFCNITGYTNNELAGKHKEEFTQYSNGAICSFEKYQPSWSGQVSIKRKDGKQKHLNTTIVPIFDTEHLIKEYISISHDITEEIELKEEIVATQREFLYRVGEMAELRSKETGQHVRRVSYFAAALAKAHGLSKEEIDLIKLASPMHDAGKIAIPDHILNKPGKLTPEEFEIMKTHAALGYEMFKSSDREILKAAGLVAITHHEKWDGSGYPNALAGEDIPIFGRLVAIADVYDALGCDRVYKKAWEEEKILDFFKEQSGAHFDPHLVELFFSIMPEIREIKEKYADTYIHNP